MRFIELISERGMEDAFKNKYAAALSTSIHYYDHTAHNYMRAACEDLNMNYVEGLSLDLLDLMKERQRQQAQSSLILKKRGSWIPNNTGR